MLLLIDNYDSFTYNLYQGLCVGGASVEVVRNDVCSVDELLAKKPQAIVLSPGPGKPDDAGVCLELIEKLPADIPLLGVCLGHQALVQAYGGQLEVDKAPVHGMSSLVHHEGSSILGTCSNPFEAGRYHSIRAIRGELPEDLRLTAWTDDGIVMAVEHKERPLYGIQFHPESILTAQGQRILNKFLSLAGFVQGA